MEFLTLADGTRVSRLTLGCWEMGGGPWEKQSDENNITVIQNALDLGITSFDTAEGYGQGHSEAVLGEALVGRRSECVVATKVSRAHLGRDDLRRALEASLRRLRTDYADIYYVHWPNDQIPMAETFGALREAQEEGLVRAIGVSNFSVDQLQEACLYAPVSLVQVEYSLLCRDIEDAIVGYCVAQGIGLMTYSSLAKGLLSGRFHPNGAEYLLPNDFRRERRLFSPRQLAAQRPLIETLSSMAHERRVPMTALAVRWLLDRPGVTSVIVGSQNMSHVKENAAACAIALSDEERRTLDRLSQQVLSVIDQFSPDS